MICDYLQCSEKNRKSTLYKLVPDFLLELIPAKFTDRLLQQQKQQQYKDV